MATELPMAALPEGQAADPVERLLEQSWDARSRRASRRELLVEAGAAALFVAVATPLGVRALEHDHRNLALAGLLVVLYAIVSRTAKFPIGAGYVVPSYLLLVPMLLLLPPLAVPLLAACAMVLGSLGRLAVRRGTAQELLFSIPDGWFAFGPALVLALAGGLHGPARAGVYAAAFMAGCLTDLACSSLREALSVGIAPKLQVRVIAAVWVVDACIAPIGLLFAHTARHGAAELLLVLPLDVLMIIAERDRSARIEEAQRRLAVVALQRSRLQTALEQAHTDPLTRLGNRRKLAEELGARLAGASFDSPLVLMLFDLDGFKAYNDAFGHLAGDALLARLGHKLAAAVAPHGSAFRLGGDEFCVLLPAGGDLRRVATDAAAALEERNDTFSVSASCGSVLLPHEAGSADYALQLADKRMYGHKHARRTGAREQAQDVLIHIMKTKQDDLQEHSSWVSRQAVRVGRRLGMDAEQLDELARAATLHDIGKVGIPDAILAKPGPLDAGEWDFIRQHTVLGDRILSAAPALRPVARIVRASHERWDGSGYPDRLRGEQIPLAARIIAVCDAYDAIVTDRCYRAASAPEVALAELERESGRQFDPAVVGAFLEELHREDRGSAANPAFPPLAPPAGNASERIDAMVGHVRSLLGERG